MPSKTEPEPQHAKHTDNVKIIEFPAGTPKPHECRAWGRSLDKELTKVTYAQTCTGSG